MILSVHTNISTFDRCVSVLPPGNLTYITMIFLYIHVAKVFFLNCYTWLKVQPNGINRLRKSRALSLLCSLQRKGQSGLSNLGLLRKEQSGISALDLRRYTRNKVDLARKDESFLLLLYCSFTSTVNIYGHVGTIS